MEEAGCFTTVSN